MNDELRGWVDRVADFLTSEYHLPPIACRVLGWLMACDPPEQSAARIAEAVGASRASLTTNLRLLTDAGLVVKRPGRGERTVYYRMDDDAWQRVLRRRIATLDSFRDLTRAGVGLVERAGGDASRVRSAGDAFASMAEALADAGRLRSSRVPLSHLS
ncbi:GbsR/MarR family transcriptional regulator [Amycolatopsis benzoatilytica]|uniref:GbsR/MarR family transcriptional regulator n=1 Tax=Amycolatopsis benzoatilytica TaxID=346045 RepID=UPI001B7FCEFE|nr:helix-turn-helix domain-containing protein [Amycolatopsis benzoatilytica]